MKWFLPASALIFIFFSLWFLLPEGYDSTQVCFDSVCVDAQIADSPEKRSLGLSGRKSLPESGAMLFVFEEPGTYGFWMKDMLFPLDIIWLDADKKVVYVSEDTSVCFTPRCPSYGPDNESLYVLEVNSGFARENNIALGTNFSFDI